MCGLASRPYPTAPADGTDEPAAPPPDRRRRPPDQSLAAAPADFDPLRAEELAAKEFEAEWAARRLHPRPTGLTATEKGWLASLLRVDWWAAGWRTGLDRIAANPFLRDGLGRDNGPLTMGDFLKSEQCLRGILDRPVPAAAATPADPTELARRTAAKLTALDQPASPAGWWRPQHAAGAHTPPTDRPPAANKETGHVAR